MDTIGERIKHIRKAKGFSMNDVSLHMGINKASLSSYENNKYDPSAQVIVKLCELFDISSDWLLTGKEKFSCASNESKWKSNNDDFKSAKDTTEHLSDDERSLISNYKKLNERDKEEIRILIAHKIKSKPEGLLSNSQILSTESSGGETA